MKIMQKMGLALLLIGFLGPIVPGLEAAEIKVKCDRGQSVQSELNGLTGPATLVVTGTCNENIVITKDDVTIQGGTFVGPDPNQNTIHVQGARRVVITGATVRGARNGIASLQGGAVNVSSSTIQGNAGAGIVTQFGSSINVNACTIQGNGNHGVIAVDNSALVLVNSTISSNVGPGVRVWKGSSARIGHNLRGDPGPNTIADNGGDGIHVYQASQANIVNNIIQNNAGDGVSIEGASARLTNNTINSNKRTGIEVHSAGNARIGINDDGSEGVGNTIEENMHEGISITNGASAYMRNNSITSNGVGTGKVGVAIDRANGRLIGGNTIGSNVGGGVRVVQGTLFIGVGGWAFTGVPDVISQNLAFGILGMNSASLEIQSVTVTDNSGNGILLNLRSTLWMYGSSTVSDNGNNGVVVLQGSAASFENPTGTQPAIITDNTHYGVFCGDDESSISGNTSGVTGNSDGDVSGSCTGF